MPCYKPITGYRSKFVNPTGKRSIVFNTTDGYRDLEVTVPCGRCTGCRLEYSRQWAVRCMHEAQTAQNNSFITLTYNNENLPTDQSIHKEHMQKFFKRLRKHLDSKYKKENKEPPTIRYFCCGEYGEKNNRPHYHAIIFGYDFPDRKVHTKTKQGHLLYRSETLEKNWKLGHSLIGDVTFDSCAYVARYVMKKRKGKDDAIDPKTGKTNKEYYLLTDPETGETTEINPEFCTMSRKPGIGKDWLLKYKSDTNKDYVTIQGVKHKLPKYYDNYLKLDDELEFIQRTDRRKAQANKRKQDNTPDRLRDKETVKEAQLKFITREI